ncbi:MAG: mandelate racemase/muconate lactonizing enzyme family protein [Bacteroidota bacterium]
MRVVSIEPVCVNVSPKTNWFFVKAVADSGLTGWGEASLNGYEPLLTAYAQMTAARLRDEPIDVERHRVRIHPHHPAGLVAHAVTSAIEQAVVDLRGQAAAQPAHELIGGAQRRRVRAYANVNRRTVDRSPAGCAASARAAVADGFRAVKIAPFDGVLPEDAASGAAHGKIEAAIARIAAMREAIGRDVELMVDCHWRLDEATAAALIRELAPLGLAWIECPISEHAGCDDANGRLRALANAHGTRLAGGEKRVGVAGFRPVFERRLFDVVMPDVKYAGGLAETARIAAEAAAAGIALSPHNPAGPVSHAASVHVSACAASFLVLEHQHAESPLFAALVGAAPRLEDGAFVVPDAPGLGVRIDEAVARAHPYQPVQPGLDPRLG